SPAWLKVTVPVPLAAAVMLAMLTPLPDRTPLDAIETASPDDAVADTGNAAPDDADPGAACVTVIVWFAFWAVTLSTTTVAALWLISPAWLNVTRAVPVPLAIVMDAEPVPIPDPAPLPVIATASPADEVAETRKLVPYVAVDGAAWVTVIVWSA